MFEIKFHSGEFKDLQEKVKGLPVGLQRATGLAINRTLEMTRTEMIRKSLGLYDVKKRDLLKDLKIVKSNRHTLYGRIESKGNLLGLDHFKLSPKKRTENKRKVGVSVKRRGHKHIPNAFIAYHDGRLGAFIRTTGERLPIKRLKGPSAPQMLGEASIIDHIENYAQEKFNTRFEHEIGRLLE